MNRTIIKIPKTTSDGKPLLFLSQLEDFELPKGILAKGGTGVGGSTIAINSKHPYIIAVPTTALIDNKMEFHANVYGKYHNSKNKSTLKDYLLATAIPVLMVTYDSFDNLVREIEAIAQETTEINIYTTFRVLVDEYTELLKSYSYRNRAVNSLLKSLASFDYVTYMSATPIAEEFTPKVFRELDYTELVWEDSVLIKPITIKTNKPFASIANTIKRFKANHYSLRFGTEITNELFIYVNSVQAIASIIEHANLAPSEVKIICADNHRNEEILDGFSIEKPIGGNKPINFLTSKSFSGCDLHSKNGLAFVISSVQKKNTLLDTATDVYQIAGRIRTIDNPFKGTIIHYYNTGLVKMTREEFIQLTTEKKARTHTHINVFNNKLNDTEKAALRKRYELNLEDDYVFYNQEINELEYDDLKEMNEAFEFSVTNEIYTNGLSVRNAYLKKGYDVQEAKLMSDIEEQFANKMSKITFKDTLKEYAHLRENDFLNDRIGVLERLNLVPNIKEVYETLGSKRIETLRYNKEKIKEAVYAESDVVKEAVSNALFTRFKGGGFHSSTQVIKAIEEAYVKMKIDKTAKSNQLLDYFPNSFKKSEWSNDLNKSVTGYEIKIV